MHVDCYHSTTSKLIQILEKTHFVFQKYFTDTNARKMLETQINNQI